MIEIFCYIAIAKRRMNMKKAAVIAAKGCEEGEVLTITDILRRAEIECDLIGLCTKNIIGAHDIEIECDSVLTGNEDYDMILLPGGYEGVDHMKESTVLNDLLKKMNEEKKLIGALCAAPSVLGEAGILDGKKFTCYPGVEVKAENAERSEDTIVLDGNILTGKGPALAWAFAYAACDLLGADSLTVKKRMVYYNAFDVKEEGNV